METQAATHTPDSNHGPLYTHTAENIVSSTQQLDYGIDKNYNDVNMNRAREEENVDQSPRSPNEEHGATQTSFQSMKIVNGGVTRNGTNSSPDPVENSHGCNGTDVRSLSPLNKPVSSPMPIISSTQELEKFNVAHQALMSLRESSPGPTGYVTFATEEGDRNESNVVNNNSILSKALKSNADAEYPASPPRQDSMSSHIASKGETSMRDDEQRDDENACTKKHKPMEIDQQNSTFDVHAGEKLSPTTSSTQAMMGGATSSIPANIVHPFMFAGLSAMSYPTAASFDPNYMAANYAMLQGYMSAYTLPTIPSNDAKETERPIVERKQKVSLEPQVPAKEKQLVVPEDKPQKEKMAKKDLRTYKCKACPRIFCHLAKLVRHEKTHLQERPFRCGIFLKKESSKSDKPFNCLMCTERFSDQTLLQSHITDIHSSTQSIIKKSVDHVDSGKKEESYKCRYCSKILRSSNDLVHHEQEHLKAKASAQESRSVPIHKVEPQPRPSHSCKICGKGFDSQYMLERHKYLEKCNPSSVSENQYPLQQRIEQSASEQEFSCPICRKKYKCEKLLKSHVKFSHLEERPHVCGICSKAFKQKATLKQHEKLHAEEKPYICNICSRGFVYPSRLKTHQQTCKPGEPALC